MKVPPSPDVAAAQAQHDAATAGVNGLADAAEKFLSAYGPHDDLLDVAGMLAEWGAEPMVAGLVLYVVRERGRQRRREELRRWWIVIAVDVALAMVNVVELAAFHGNWTNVAGIGVISLLTVVPMHRLWQLRKRKTT